MSAVATLAPPAPTPSTNPFPDLAVLSNREREVALLMLVGMNGTQIAGRLFISRRTVESHAEQVYRKLGVRGRVELGRKFAALQNRLLGSLVCDHCLSALSQATAAVA